MKGLITANQARQATTTLFDSINEYILEAAEKGQDHTTITFFSNEDLFVLADILEENGFECTLGDHRDIFISWRN